MNTKRKMRDSWDDEFDLVQNNGRVTLPAKSSGTYPIDKHLPILILLGASLLIVLLAARK
jgi:hypothetical protein